MQFRSQQRAVSKEDRHGLFNPYFDVYYWRRVEPLYKCLYFASIFIKSSVIMSSEKFFKLIDLALWKEWSRFWCCNRRSRRELRVLLHFRFLELKWRYDVIKWYFELVEKGQLGIRSLQDQNLFAFSYLLN